MTDRKHRLPSALSAALAVVILLTAALPLGILLTPAPAAAALGDLDELELYEITVTPRSDATLDMTCHIVWKVLDDESEGPLEWVKIGIPNANADSVRAQSDCIRSASRSGTYIEVYFKQKYHAGETVDFTFSWHQGYMFTVGANDDVTFDYTPGWFDESDIDRMTVVWNAEGAKTYTVTGGTDTSDGYTVSLEAGKLTHGKRVNLVLTYPVSVFPDIDMKKDASHALTEEKIALIVFAVVALTIIAIVAIWKWNDYRKYEDPDYWTGGYEDDGPYAGSEDYVHVFIGWRYYPHGHRPMGSPSRRKPSVPRPEPSSGGSGGHGGGHGGGCACACACACAGGGRAGCSRKNILGTDISRLKIPGENGKQ